MVPEWYQLLSRALPLKYLATFNSNLALELPIQVGFWFKKKSPEFQHLSVAILLMDKFRQTTKDDDYPIIYMVLTHPNGGWDWNFWTIQQYRAPARTISSAASFTWTSSTSELARAPRVGGQLPICLSTQQKMIMIKLYMYLYIIIINII